MLASFAMRSDTLPNIYNLDLSADMVPLTHFADSGKVCETFAVRTPSPQDFTVQIGPKLDTHHIFNWKFGAPLVAGRFRGQYTDYIALNGRYYSGQSANLLPVADTEHSIVPPSNSPHPGRYDLFVPQYPLNVNDDAYEDLVMISYDLKSINKNPRLWGLIMYGADSITKFRYKTIEAPLYPGWSDHSYVFDVYQTQSGLRILWQETSDDLAVIRIGKFVENDTTVKIVALASFMYDSPGTLYKNVGGVRVYNNPKTLEATLLISHSRPTGAQAGSGLNVFSMDRDTFDYVRHYPGMIFNTYCYNRSHGNNYDDGWVSRAGPWDVLDTSSKLFFFRGSPRDSNVIGIYPLLGKQVHGTDLTEIVAIGDINNDGSLDHAINYTGFYEVVSGSSASTTVEDNEGQIDSPMLKTVICQKNVQSCHMDWYSESAGVARMTLYNVSGRKLNIELDVSLVSGLNRIQLSDLLQQVDSGFYILQVQQGTATSNVKLCVQ